MQDAKHLAEQHIAFAFGQFLISADKSRYIPTDDDIEQFVIVARRLAVEQQRRAASSNEPSGEPEQ